MAYAISRTNYQIFSYLELQPQLNLQPSGSCDSCIFKLNINSGKLHNGNSGKRAKEWIRKLKLHMHSLGPVSVSFPVPIALSFQSRKLSSCQTANS